MFRKFFLNVENVFDRLNNSCETESVCRGRSAAILAAMGDDEGVPIVRTTTAYNKSVQLIQPVHKEIINSIRSDCPQVQFNNIMFEQYDDRYRTMGFHSDQALDLEKDSHIAIFSCYNNPHTTSLRVLVVKNKQTNEVKEITLQHNSVVIFSLETNRNYVHQIILKGKEQTKDIWIGLTMRKSSTRVQFIEAKPFIGDKELSLATEDEKIEFRKQRALENKRSDFYWPKIDYTTSPSDLLQIKGSI